MTNNIGAFCGAFEKIICRSIAGIPQLPPVLFVQSQQTLPTNWDGSMSLKVLTTITCDTVYNLSFQVPCKILPSAIVILVVFVRSARSSLHFDMPQCCNNFTTKSGTWESLWIPKSNFFPFPEMRAGVESFPLPRTNNGGHTTGQVDNR